jgi:hypothetical protein
MAYSKSPMPFVLERMKTANPNKKLLMPIIPTEKRSSSFLILKTVADAFDIYDRLRTQNLF